MVTSTSNLDKFSIDGEDLKQGGLESPSLAAMLKLVLAQTILYHLASNLVKASFLVQYLRLFLVIPQIVWICNVLLILVFGATAWGIFGNIFLCEPVQSYWNVTLSGKCMNKENHFWSTSIIGLVLDFSIWILPIPVIGKLNLPSRQKLGLVAVFGLGGFVCIITLLRLVLVHDAANDGEVTKAGTYAIIFSTIEVNVAIICGSLLVMKPLIARFLPGLMSEQPMTAAEDERTCRTLTGLHLLSGGTEGDVEKAQRGRRRDTLIESDAFATTKEMKRLMKGLGNSKRNTM
ncbi:hypothetical protein J4E85_000075 [Alternaria conjuncta]|nr:uncharacterized protein J4E85_000075 [Alternaria conjuncta]KAI4627771.1 hypothetical protein J4E80_001905 [Alternaria sp. BMP 0032]KAI4937640.1 hypothetical protein J4E85_000075 [Alternaria conjuncta]